MARLLLRPLTELDKYRLNSETRAWVQRMRQRPPKAPREPEKPMEQMTIPDTDRPMVSRTERGRQLLAEEKARRTTR